MRQRLRREDGHVVSVVIPSVGRGTLGACIRALEAQTRCPDQVVVVRDGERRGASWARNEGFRRSCGDLVAFTDDDCLPGPEWLETLVSAIDRHGAAGAGGVYREQDPLLEQIRLRRDVPSEEVVDASGLVGNTGNVAYRRAWLEACIERDGHLFDEGYRSAGEDYDLAWRLRRRGARLVFVPVAVTHCRRMGPLGFLGHQFHRGVGIARLFRAHQRAPAAGTAAQQSLLWDESGAGGRRWLRAVWRKVFGPFDRGSFSRLRDFALFWAGTKAQGLGFAWGMLRQRGSISGFGKASR